MQYGEIRPHDALAAHVQCFWRLYDPEARADRPPERIVPDGCMELVFNLADLFARRCGDIVQRGLRTYLIGEIDRHVIAYPADRVHLLGVRFHPGGFRQFMRMPMNELAGRVVSLDELWGGRAREIEEMVLEARTTRERIGIVERALLDRLDRGVGVDPTVAAAMETIMRRHGQVGIAALARELEVSERRLERRFREVIGMTPKGLSRLARFRRIVRAAERSRGRESWAGLALEAGYADQAHFINDFRSFAGESPARFFAGYHQMSDFFNTGTTASA